MLLALSIIHVYAITSLFAARLAGAFVTVTSWLQILLHFIPKSGESNTLKDHRGIAVSSAMSKWYMATLLSVMFLTQLPDQFMAVNVVGYEPSCSTDCITTPLITIPSFAVG